jgi:hypothetical protein
MMITFYDDRFGQFGFFNAKISLACVIVIPEKYSLSGQLSMRCPSYPKYLPAEFPNTGKLYILQSLFKIKSEVRVGGSARHLYVVCI